MKKLLALILALGLMFCFVACGSDSDNDYDDDDILASLKDKIDDDDDDDNDSKYDKDDEDEDVDVDDDDDEDDNDSKVTTSSGKTAINKYLNSIKSQLDDLVDNYESMGILIDVYAEGNDTLVYEYTYKNQIDAKAAKESLESTLDSTDDTFKENVKQINKECSAVKKIKVVYVNADGKTITSRTYKV